MLEVTVAKNAGWANEIHVEDEGNVLANQNSSALFSQADRPREAAASGHHCDREQDSPPASGCV